MTGGEDIRAAVRNMELCVYMGRMCRLCHVHVAK